MRRILIGFLILLVASPTPLARANGTGSGVPPPVGPGMLEKQAAIFMDKTRPPRERVEAIQVFLKRPGFQRSIAAKVTALWKTLMDDPATPLALRVAVAGLYYPGEEEFEAKETARRRYYRTLIHEALASDDEAVHLALSKVGYLFTPVATVRALRHPSALVRGAAFESRALRNRRLSDVSAELLRPLLRDPSLQRHHSAALRIRNGDGRFDPELDLILARREAQPSYYRYRILLLLHRPFTKNELGFLADHFSRLDSHHHPKSHLLRIIQEAKAGKHADVLKKLLASVTAKDEEGKHRHVFRSCRNDELERTIREALAHCEGGTAKEAQR